MLFRLASASALAAAASMAAAPLAAVEVPRNADQSASGVLSSDAVTAHNHRWRHRDRVDAGDVIAGVLVLGTIAAVASAASNAKRDRGYRYPQSYPYPNERYDYRSPRDSHYDGNRGIDRAIDMCAREVQRSARVDTVDGVERNGDGWRVTGRLVTGDPFTCSVGSDGRIGGVDYGHRGADADGQWTDDRYAAARRSQDGTGGAAYPGGPPGDQTEVDDGRYDAAQSPDFPG